MIIVMPLYEMLSNKCHGFYDLDYCMGSAGHNSADNSTPVLVWTDLK
jgi:hypothetical protein